MKPVTLDKLRSIHKLLGEVIAYESDETNPSTGLTAEETDLMETGSVIYAIKAVRNRLGIGLKEAKEVVERAGDKMGLRVPDDSAWGNHKWLKRR
jgi:ribosomal protein L7/L12